MSVAMTLAPSLAKANADAAPMPWPAAVTTQVLPASLIASPWYNHSIGLDLRYESPNLV